MLMRFASNVILSLSKRPFRLARGEWGVKVRVVGAWEPSIAEFVVAHGLAELELNYIHGFSDNRSSPVFLPQMRKLRGVKIAYGAYEDLSPVGDLADLEYLAVTFSRSTHGLRLERLPRLTKLALEWYPGAEGLFELEHLQDLALFVYPGKAGSQPFARLRQMREMRISSCGLEEIEAFAGMTNLTRLELLAMAHMRSLHGVEGLTGLRSLRVEACPQITSIEPVAGLTGLRHLSISDCRGIQSLAPLRGLERLERLEFWGSTRIIDGDLQVLRELPRLREVRFENRRHYNARRQEFGD